MNRYTPCLSLMLALVSCGKSKTISANYQETVTYYTHGSPSALIAGATPDTSGLLATAESSNFQNFHLMSTIAFTEKSRQSTVSSFGEVEEQNRTDTGGSETTQREVPIYRFTDEGSGRLVWSSENDPRSPVFGFDATGTLLKLTDIDNQPAEVVHYSLKADKLAFSLLVKHTQGSSGIVLTSYVFGSSAIVNTPVYTTGDYQYLHGSEKIGWGALPEVKLCGSPNATVTQTIQKSVQAWGASDALAGSAPLPVTFSVPTVFPPFSDLNFHCIYLVPEFDISDSPIAKTLGVNLPAISQATRKIIDSDIFLFSDLIPTELESGEAGPVTMHEMGHFWGLGHDFRSDSNGDPLHETIMGYSKGADVVTAWDFEAIRELYGAGFVFTP